jgi:ribosomal-protein-alanine N-acetyltransferase
MTQISLRPQEISDAQRFYDILKNPKFIYFSWNPKSIEDEANRIKISKQDFEKGTVYNYTIIGENSEIIWGIWVKINSHRPYIGEIWYFVDETYRWQGIASKAVQILETFCFDKLNIKRLEIIMDPQNIASEKVAIKVWYTKEWLMKKCFVSRLDDDLHDAWLYAKTI